jgi:H+-translocating NAD(P) transhydrogenase subunit beta
VLALPVLATRNDASLPIYGMPILNVDQSRSVIVLKRSMATPRSP